MGAFYPVGPVGGNARRARCTADVDLPPDPDFQWAFADAMVFPESGD